MENDPDYDAMTNAPIVDEEEDVDMQETTVIEGGPSGGLFLQDDSDDELDTAMRDAQRADGNVDSGAQSSGSHQASGTGQELVEEESEEDDEDEESDEEDDPIVKTYQICATKVLTDHLYLFQYPIRPANRPYEAADRPSEARMKPRIGQVQIDIPIQETAYYDNARATQWTDRPLRTQTLGGTIAKGRNYLIGRIEGDELHVTPVAGVAQIRPIFKYIDEHEQEEKDARKSDADKGPRGPKAIQLSAKSADATPDLSTTALIRRAEEENWTKLQWCDKLHEKTAVIAGHLTSKKPEVSCKALTKKEEYLNMLSTLKKDKK